MSAGSRVKLSPEAEVWLTRDIGTRHGTVVGVDREWLVIEFDRHPMVTRLPALLVERA